MPGTGLHLLCAAVSRAEGEVGGVPSDPSAQAGLWPLLHSCCVRPVALRGGECTQNGHPRLAAASLTSGLSVPPPGSFYPSCPGGWAGRFLSLSLGPGLTQTLSLLSAKPGTVHTVETKRNDQKTRTQTEPSHRVQQKAGPLPPSLVRLAASDQKQPECKGGTKGLTFKPPSE